MAQAQAQVAQWSHHLSSESGSAELALERTLSISASMSATVSSLSWKYPALKQGSTKEFLSINSNTQADS